MEAQPPEAQAIVAEQSRLVRFSLCPTSPRDPYPLSYVILTSRKKCWASTQGAEMDTVLTSTCRRSPCGQADLPGGLLLLQPLF